MNIFSKRPLLLALFVFTFCACISALISQDLRKILLIVSFNLLVISILTYLVFLITKSQHRNKFLSVTLCFCFAFAAFLSSHTFFDKKLAKIEILSDEQNVIAIIDECTFSAVYSTTYTANVISIDGVKTNFKASISSNPPIYLEEGEMISADMSFSPFTVSDYGYDARRSNISNGIFVSATFENAEILDNDNNFNIVSAFNRLRNKIERRIDKNYDTSAPIIKALLIGKTDNIDAMTKSNFSRLGISHILSISGTHFTVLLGMIAILLSVLGLNKRVIYVLLIPIAFFYIGLSGFSFSVCRAGIMALLSYFGFLCGKLRDFYTALFISLTVILLFSPYAVFSISLWLSFTATLTILLIIDLLSVFLSAQNGSLFKKISKYIIVRLLISVSVIFSTLPIVSIYFGYISLIAPLANLIIVPFFELFLYIIPFSVIFATVSPISALTEKFGEWLLFVVEEIASIDGLLIAINHDFVKLISVLGVAATLILVAIPLKKKFIILIPSLLSVLSITASLFFFYDTRLPETHVTYYNTAISDGIVITDTNRTACIDITSGTTSSMYYTQAVVREHYSTKISAYVFTHYRNNHVNAFEKLASRMKISKVYFPNATTENGLKYMNNLIEIAKLHDIEIIMFEYGQPIAFEECEITVLEPQFIKRSSHEVISVYVSTKEDDMLYLGSSFSDSNFDYSNYISDAEYIIFGQHYPKAKNEFELSTNANLIYGSKEIFDLSKPREKVYLLNNGDRYNFLLK